jgi:hypothetical protein
MKNEPSLCPLCGNLAEILNNKISTVERPKCGNYKYVLSVHPFLNENNLRNMKILTTLSEISKEKSTHGENLVIDLEMYQKLDK